MYLVYESKCNKLLDMKTLKAKLEKLTRVSVPATVLASVIVPLDHFHL